MTFYNENDSKLWENVSPVTQTDFHSENILRTEQHPGDQTAQTFTPQPFMAAFFSYSSFT